MTATTEHTDTDDMDGIEHTKRIKRQQRIRSLLEECVQEARDQGFEGSADEYDYTAADLEWVTDQLGYKPTRRDWEGAGLEYIGSAHIGEGPSGYTARRKALLERLAWTPYGPTDLAEEVGYSRKEISNALHGHATSAPVLDAVEDFLDGIESERPA